MNINSLLKCFFDPSDSKVFWGVVLLVFFGHLYTGWLILVSKDFGLLVIILIFFIEYCFGSLYYSKKNFDKINHVFIVAFCLASYFFLDNLFVEIFNGPRMHLRGAALQHYLFFFLMPRWLYFTSPVNSIKKYPHVVAWLLFVSFHVPNWPLVVVTFFGGIVFVFAYRFSFGKKWWWAVSLVLILGHYFVTDLLKDLFSMNMLTGARYKGPGFLEFIKHLVSFL